MIFSPGWCRNGQTQDGEPVVMNDCEPVGRWREHHAGLIVGTQSGINETDQSAVTRVEYPAMMMRPDRG
jgi:hypothetical protein